MIITNRLWNKIQGVPLKNQKMRSFPVKPEMIEQKLVYQLMSNLVYVLPTNFQTTISNDSEVTVLAVFCALPCIQAVRGNPYPLFRLDRVNIHHDFFHRFYHLARNIT